MKKTPPTPPRPAFTLVEMLVVIAIIAILSALVTGGVMKVRERATAAQNSTDISQLATALGTFKTKFGVYPPSKIRLKEDGTYDMTINAATKQPNTPLDYDSKNYLMRIWPRIQPSIDWNGDGNTTGDWILEGDQCLVFFLGGVPTQNPRGCIGFSTSPTNPGAPKTATAPDRIGPFYEFKNARLALLHGNPFFSYLDAYGEPGYLDGTGTPTVPAFVGLPFAYFASDKKRSNYNPVTKNKYFYYTYDTTTNPITTDCMLIVAYPYIKQVKIDNTPSTVSLFGSPVNMVFFHNSDSYQLISAGANKKFGGGMWDPTNPNTFTYDPVTPPSVSPFGFDDLTNFCANILGAGN